MGNETIVEVEEHKKGRRRRKKLYNSILQQMEFYFSDANLSKDRFLSNLTKEEPYVDISTFLKFNKIRKLTSSVDAITQAIAKSELLELSEDKTKVKRKLPVNTKTNVDECTLYVERLKSDATHDWLTTIFSDFGNVSYVSIPKYKNSGIIKGFAFVEFEQEESVQTALQYFEEIGCKIPSDMEPEQLCSIVTYHMETNSGGSETKNDEKEDVPRVKRAKLDEDNVKIPQENVEKLPNDDAGTEVAPVDDNERKKQKKSNKKKGILKQLGLQILSKKDWKKMRNRYLDMQRKSMRELKMHLNRQRFAQKYEVTKTQAPKDTSMKETKEAEVPVPQIEFIPNVIVKLVLQEACYLTKAMKKKVKSLSPNIKYVDIPYGSTDAFLRFGDGSSAEEFCLSKYKDQSCLLQGDDEKSYWEKIAESASEKKEKQMKNNKQRGRDKLLKKAEKRAINHIRFNEEAVQQI